MNDTAMLGVRAWSKWRSGPVGTLLDRMRGGPMRPVGQRGRAARSLRQQHEHIGQELVRAGHPELAEALAELPEHFLLARSAESIAAHLTLAAEPIGAGQVWTRIRETGQADTWELLVVARDRPGLLATMAGVLALRGISVLAADAATHDGVALDAFTIVHASDAVSGPTPWSAIAADLAEALSGRRPVEKRIEEHHAGRDDPPGPPPLVTAADESSGRYTLIEVRGPDRLGLLYDIARALYDLNMDIHYAEIETHPTGVVDRFYVRGLDAARLDAGRAATVADELEARLASRFGAARSLAAACPAG